MIAPTIVRYTVEEWRAEGERLFGPDVLKWRFVCPSCGNVATPEDYRPFADKGAHPNSATCECIGRYSGAKSAFDKSQRPCNYAGYGLFRLSPVRIIGAAPGDQDQHCFGFATESFERAK